MEPHSLGKRLKILELIELYCKCDKRLKNITALEKKC